MATLKAPTKIGKHPNWCGPTAMSILTGRSINYCAKLIGEHRNETELWRQRTVTSRMVKGTNNYEVRHALSRMGFEMIPVKIPLKNHPHQVMSVNPEPFVKPTLRTYMAERGGEQWKNPMLIETGYHYVTALKDQVSDHNATSHYDNHPYKRSIVRTGWIVKRKKKR